jgi:hypothetical protein
MPHLLCRIKIRAIRYMPLGNEHPVACVIWGRL